MKNKSNLSILLVEDNIFYAEVIKENLQMRGYTNIRHSRNGIECLLAVFEDEAPKVIIMDHNLEILTGLDLLKRIISSRPDIKILFLSSEDQVDLAISAVKCGASDYFIKDEEVFDNLGEALDEISERQAGRPSSSWVHRSAVLMKSFLF